ncbi:hypothetical protein D3C81_1030280 [compost metagenome]
MQRAHLGNITQRLDHGRHLLWQHRDQYVRAHLPLLVILVGTHGVTGDHALLLQPVDAALHGGARQPQPPGDLCGGGAGVFAQDGKQALVGGRNLHIAHRFRRFAEINRKIVEITAAMCPESPDNGYTRKFWR